MGVAPRREVGITVMPEFFQNEGVDGVLDNLVGRARATAIATSPYVMAPAPDGEGGREPPIDGGAGAVRLLDRPLWGRRALSVRTAPSFVPDLRFYEGLRYRPAVPDALTSAHGAVVGHAIRAAKERGLEAHLQVQAAIPPGYRVQFGGPVDEDRPSGPNGPAEGARVDNNGSLASPHLLAYTRALLRDVIRAYPEIDALRIDWPEYPPYAFEALFFDHSVHARAFMTRMGHDPERLRAAAARLRARVTTGLTPADLAYPVDAYAALRAALRDPDLVAWLRVKTRIVTDFVGACRETVADASKGRITLMPQAFPEPWTLFSGFDARAIAATGVGAIGVKLYTMHWPMIVRGWADAIGAANPALAGQHGLITQLVRVLDLDERPERWAAEGLDRYPEPEEPHPAGPAAQAAKIRRAVAEAAPVPVHAFAHGYGPLADVAARARIAFEAADGRLWINRYGYLSDAKLDALGGIGAA
jgi:hypothetical protein